VKRALIASFGASGAIQLVNVLSGVVLARQLGPSSRGALAAVVLWPSLLATVGMLGLPDALTVRTARRDRELSLVVGTGLAAAALQAAALVAIGLAAIPFVLSHYGAPTVHLALAFLLFVPLNLTTLGLMGVLNGLERYAAFQTLRVLVTGLSAGAIFALAGSGRLDLKNAVVAYLTANAIALAAALWLARSVLAGLRVSRALMRELLVFGAKSHTSGVSTLLNERLDQLVISAFLAPMQLGLYVIAVTFTSVTTLVGTSVAFVALPVISRNCHAEALAMQIRRMTVITLTVSLAVSVPLIALAPQLIELFFGRSYLPVTNVCRVLLAAVVMLSMSRTLAAALKGAGRPLQAGLADGIGLLVTVVALGALLPPLGLLGAAIASVLAYGATLLFMARAAGRVVGTSARGLVSGRGSVVPVAITGIEP
jgi:O-antigen/teichoic acid export membrane protein